MTTLTPREPYSKEELERLYPKNLKLQLVQVFLRHGIAALLELLYKSLHKLTCARRTDSRHRSIPKCMAGLPAYWPYCAIARRMTAMVATKEDLSTWDNFQWRRRMEAFGHNDEAVIAAGPGGEAEGICQLGELTDKGRETTFALGQRLRHLYVDQLGFMPKIKSDAEDMYLRTTPIPRALESLQQVFRGMYPAHARTADFAPPIIVARALADETLYPNEGNCRRLRQLAKLFADRAAERWNNSEQMDYLNRLWSKWMPPSSPRVAVDSHPRLSGIMDTINASLAHGPSTRLPPAFYDEKGREIMDKIAVEEWFSGYKENVEYRKLGIGALVGDIVDRMVSTAVEGGWRSETSSLSASPGKPIKFALSGCHDTTIAAILASMGAFENEKWPPFTSSIAIELFSTADRDGHESAGNVLEELSNPTDASSNRQSSSSFLSFLIGQPSPSQQQERIHTARTPLSELPESTRQTLRNHYVRIRYNDRPVRIPGCAAKPTNHLPGDDTFCTLEAFKEIADTFTPRQWKKECQENIDEGIFGRDGKDRVPAGY